MRNLITRFALALVGLGLTGAGAQAQLYNLSSQLTYSGRQTGEVWVVASPSRTPLVTNYMTRLSAPVSAPFTNVAVTVSNLPAFVSYHLVAWRDSDGNGTPDVNEAQAWHTDSPFLMSSNRMEAGFEIEDPDADGDGLPDFWEVNYGLSTLPGSGRSGALTLATGETVFTDNIWASVAGANPAGTNTLTISTNRGFSTNDLVLIVTMQDTNTNWTLNQAGTFEFARVASASSNVLTLRSNRLNAFTAGTANKIQVLKVPEYTDVSVPSASALQFDGTNHYVGAGWVPLANVSFTIEAWARRASANSIDFIVGQGSAATDKGLHFGFHQIVNNQFVLGFYNDDLFTANSYVDTNWHHWAGTYNATNRTRCIYQDGVLLASDVAVSNYQGSGTFYIARPSWGLSGGAFHGAIDEVRVWNLARSQAEIQADMGRGLAGTEPGLLAYYRLDEGIANFVQDATGHGYNGWAYSAPVWSPPCPKLPTGLTCQPWNGTNGGVVAFVAHHLTLASNGVVSADGKGYRGGDTVPSGADYEWGKAGERTAGFSTARETTSLGLERPQGGGGPGKGADASGGGGGYGGPGSSGAKLLTDSDYGRGATTLYGDSSLARLYSGGGGGSAGSHSGGRTGIGGGAGGGIVILAAASVDGNGTISSRGASGQTSVYAVNANSGAGSGGGAGGSLYAIANLAASVQLAASGGAGGLHHPSGSGKDGGAGGAGRIRLDLPPDIAPPTNAVPPPGYTNQSLAGLSLLLTGAGYDSDYDGLPDRQEYDLDTSPVKPDTDGDTLPDQWEVDHGLNPTSAADAGAGQDLDSDGVENVLEYRRGTRPNDVDSDDDGLSDSAELFVHRTDPLRQDTDGDGTNDAQELAAGRDPLFSGTQYFYDALDRLTGAQYENGLGLGYEYDRNNNLLRQVYLLHDGTTNNLPDVWEFINGLTNNTSGFVDTDGDGWSDYQEWQAGTHPRESSSQPDLLGSAGTSLASLAMPFTPSNFVVGVGQLDGIGAEEIVIGADGIPGATTNFLLVLSQTESGWSTQRVDIGSFGVTSIAVGQPANRPGPAIYLGLRQAGGTGSVAELVPAAGQWTLNPIAVSTNEEAFVLGVRPGGYVLASLARTNGPPGCPYYLTCSSAWTNVLANTSASHRGLGTMTLPGRPGAPARGLRLVNSGGLRVIGHDVNVPADAIWNEDYSRWFFRTASTYAWADAQTYASNSFGGNLATVTDATLDAWLWSKFGGAGYSFWIGLFRESTSAPWQWASRAPFTYANWAPNEPSGNGLGAHKWENYAGKWDDTSSALRGVVEVTATEDHSIAVDEPPAAQRLLWRGHSLNAGSLRLTNAVSLLYAFVDDTNLNGLVDSGDQFVVAEYLFSGSNVVALGSQRLPLSATSLAASYGLACVDVLYGQQQVLFTAGPDGRLYAWSATNSTPTLQCQLFSAHHAGMAWHALAGARTLEAGQSLAGLRVDPATPNRCDVILWPPQQQLPVLAEVPQSAPVTQILPSPGSGRDIAPVNLLIWDAEGNASRPDLQYRWSGQNDWSNATIAAIDGAAYGFTVTSPTGCTHQVSWDAARDLGPGFTNTVALRARAQDNTLTGDWSPPVDYGVQNSLANNPRACADFATAATAVPVNIDVLANDTVDNSAPRLIASLGIPAHGAAVTNLNGTVRYTSAPDFVGTDQFIYLLTDGAGAYSMATVTVTVTEAAPVTEIVLVEPQLEASNSWFSLRVTGPPGVYQVQASTNLLQWWTAAYVTNVSGSVPFTEPVPSNAPARFYRALRVTAAPAEVLILSPVINATNGFSLLINGPPGAYEVLVSTNLTQWSNVAWATNTSGSVSFAEPYSANAPARFYRARLAP